MESLKAWFKRTFSDPQIVMLALILLISALIIFGLGKMLAPVFTAMVIAYLLEVIVDRLERLGMARIWAVIIVFLLFLAILFFLIFGLIPMLARQSWLNLSVERVMYSEVSAFASRYMPDRFLSQLGDSTSPTFTWDDLTVYTVGWTWSNGKDLQWHVDLSTRSTPSPNSRSIR